jgi:hypothetical protein
MRFPGRRAPLIAGMRFHPSRGYSEAETPHAMRWEK